MHENELSEKIIGVAIKVHKNLGPGLLESAYEECLYYELEKLQLKIEKQKPMPEEAKKLFGIDKLNIVRSEVPAITHVDYSARIQSVNKKTNPLYHEAISKFEKNENCAVIVNTSFNVRGEPIVGSPTDAFKCFMGTELDVLAVGNCFLRKEDQDTNLAEDLFVVRGRHEGPIGSAEAPVQPDQRRDRALPRVDRGPARRRSLLRGLGSPGRSR